MDPNTLSMISGIIKDIIFNNDRTSLLIEDEEEMPYVFHIYDYTIVLTFETLKIEQEVDIIFNGILTRSLPPQGTAIIVNGLKV